MTKKKEKDGGNLQHKEAFMRMNFLHQAAALLSASAGGAGQASQADAMLNLGTHYANTMKTVGKKLVIRDPAVKRTICKHCNSVAVPGISADLRIKSGPAKRTSIKCRRCGSTRNLPHADPSYINFSAKAPAYDKTAGS